MGVLGEYDEALGAVVARHEGTLTNFSGDGLMVLVNAPVPCPDPAWRAVEMAIDMQRAAQVGGRVPPGGARASTASRRSSTPVKHAQSGISVQHA